jgi:hypothetical protein
MLDPYNEHHPETGYAPQLPPAPEMDLTNASIRVDFT